MTNDSIRSDALREVVNIGSGQAAGALSDLLRKKVFITVPDLRLIPIEKVAAHLGGASSPVLGIFFEIAGDLSGRILLVFTQASGRTLAALLAGEQSGTGAVLSDMERSAVMEAGNIIANSYLNGLAGLLDMRLFPSVPYYAEDMLGAVIDSLLIDIAQAADQALFITTEMKIETDNLSGSLLVFPDEAFLQRIFERLKLE